MDHKSETPNSSLNYPKLRLRRRVGLFNLLLGRFGFCNPRLSSHGITSIQYGYIIEATISYYPIRNGWKLWYGKNGLLYYKSIQDCRSYDLQNLGLKIHNFSLELKQSKTPPAASCWIISTLVRRYVFFNPRFCKSWDCPILVWHSNNFAVLYYPI